MSDNDDDIPLLKISTSSTEVSPDCNRKGPTPQRNQEVAIEEQGSLYLPEPLETISLSDNDDDEQKEGVLSAVKTLQKVSEETFPSPRIDPQDAITNVSLIEIEQPVGNDGAGPSNAAQSVIVHVDEHVNVHLDEQEASRKLEEPQNEDNTEEEVHQEVILDLSPLIWQDALLVAAVKSGSPENVRRSLQRGASARSVDHATNLSCAQLATLAGHAEILKKLLNHCDLEEHNADAFEVDSLQKTLLHLAVDGKHYECLQILVQKGQVSRIDSSGESPLFAAVKLSWADGVCLLLGAGADVKAKYGKEPQKTVLHLAVQQKDVEVFEAIVTEVCRLNDCETIINATLDNETALFKAAKSGWAEGVRLLLNAGADGQIINAKFENESPLFIATNSQWLEGVRLLLKAGADVEGKSGKKTVLQSAVLLDSFEIFEEIVNRVVASCVNPEERKKVIDAMIGGQTPLLAAVRNGKLEFVVALLEAGADVTVLSADQWNLLHFAASNGHLRVIEKLFECKSAEMETLLIAKCKGSFHGTPLHFAVKEGHAKCVEYLIKKCTEDTFGHSEDTQERVKKLNLLHLASLSPKQEVRDFFSANLYKNHLKIQTKLHSLLHQTTETGRTPLHYALERRQTEFVIALISSGSDLTAKCKFTECDYRTAIDILIHRMPGSVPLLTTVFDRSIRKPDKAEYVHVDYKALCSHEKISEDPDHGFGVLNALRETGDLLGQRKVLEHPLVASYLYEHWRVLRGPYWTFVVLNYIYTIFLGVFVLMKPCLENSDTSLGAEEPYSFESQCYMPMLWIFVALTVFLPMALLFIHELQCIGNLKRWTYRIESFVKCIYFILTIVICFPGSPPECSSFAVLLATFELIIITSRIPGRGSHMLMFIEVTKKCAILLLSFISVIFGFTVAFMMTFRTSKPFNTVLGSLMKTIVMMANEFEYENLQNATTTRDLNLSLSSQLLAMLTFILFIILISFVLTNLLVVVAVIKVNNLHRISKQVVFLYNYRRLLLHPPKWWGFEIGIMQMISTVCQCVCSKSIKTTTTSHDPFDEVQGLANPADELVMCRKIEISRRGGSSDRDTLNSELVKKGIEDRERLTKKYEEEKRLREDLKNINQVKEI